MLPAPRFIAQRLVWRLIQYDSSEDPSSSSSDSPVSSTTAPNEDDAQLDHIDADAFTTVVTTTPMQSPATTMTDIGDVRRPATTTTVPTPTTTMMSDGVASAFVILDCEFDRNNANYHDEAV